jgi:uncharacterized protein YqjF (DUF2071 family)
VAKLDKVFLTAEWMDLLMLNYQVAPEALAAYVPRGTCLDSYQGKTYMTLVGFWFRKTKLFGSLPVPFHRDFLEINLRFYVRRSSDSEQRRGVVFIAEIVPKRLIALVARVIYGENYLHRPMRSVVRSKSGNTTVQYEWRSKDSWCSLAAKKSESPTDSSSGSVEQFITEHYWGYSAQRNGGCLEYQVMHPVWRVWPCTEAGFEGDPSPEYGPEIATILRGKPSSSFVADGSAVTVYKGVNLPGEISKNGSSLS